jgi:hypothetical protein
MNHKCPYCSKEYSVDGNFNIALLRLKNADNKPAFLMDVFGDWHGYIEHDTDNYSRLSGIIKHAHNDYAYLLKVIWDTASVGIVGSHLNYIDAIICKRNNNQSNKINKQPVYK